MLQVLRKARIVGMTTSGVAKMQQLIAALQPKVLIIEEAGELFEAHLLACLGPQTEHAILIGEHDGPADTVCKNAGRHCV